MKHFIAFFLSLSVFCFIAFGISVAVLGTQNQSTDMPLLDEYNRLDDSYTDIEIYTSTASVVVYPCDNDYTSIFVTNNMRKFVSAKIDNGTLSVKLDSTSYIFTDFFGFLKSAFSGSTGECVKVYVPRRIYDSINVTTTAGSTEMIDVAAEYISLDTNAGSLVYAQPENQTAKQLDVSVSAGSCTVYNADAESFDISMSAGSIDVYGLTGEGSIDVSAGSGNINMAELNGNIDIELSAGGLELNLPENISAEIECDISGGGVEVDYGDIKTSMKDTSLVIGKGEYHIFADVSAGGVDITDKVKEKHAPDVPGFPSDYSDEDIAYTSTHPASVDSSVGLEPIEPINIDPIKIDPITVKVD